MSLKSTRKRLKDCLEIPSYSSNIENKQSLISKNAKTPHGFFDVKNNHSNEVHKVEKKSNAKVPNYIENKKIEQAKKEAYKIHIDKNEPRIKDKIRFSKKKENLNLLERYNEKPKKKNIKLIVAMVVVELITLILIFSFGFAIRLANTTQIVPFNVEEVRSDDIDTHTLETMKGYRTVAIFGLDSRTGSVGKGNNADVNIIANIDLSTGAVQLVSIYRDLYVNVTDDNTYGKINSAYMHGGPEKAVKALNKNFDLDITNYVSFNWKAVAQGIDMLGGIDLEITNREFRYINAFIHETCRATGISKDNPAAYYLKSSGYQHLNGIQAVAYARLRLMDSDFQRVERQRKVIQLCLEKAKTLDVDQIMGIAISIIPTVSYNFDWGELTSLIKSIQGIHIVESSGFPDGKHFVSMDMGPNGDCIVPATLELAVPTLHKLLYNNESYTPSKTVKNISNNIAALRRKYEEENRIKESIKQKEKEEEEKRKKKASASNAKKKKATNSNAKSRDEDEEDLTVDDEKVRDIPLIIDENGDLVVDPNYEGDIEYEEEVEEETVKEKETKKKIEEEMDGDGIVRPGSIKTDKNADAPHSSTNDNAPGGNVSTIDGPPGSNTDTNTNIGSFSSREGDVAITPPFADETTRITNIDQNAPFNSSNSDNNFPPPPIVMQDEEGAVSGPPIG